MTELEFGQVISSLWASQMWGNKSYLVDKMIQENGLPALITQLKNLLWGQGTSLLDTMNFARKSGGLEQPRWQRFSEPSDIPTFLGSG